MSVLMLPLYLSPSLSFPIAPLMLLSRNAAGGTCHLQPPPHCKHDSDCAPKGVDPADVARHVEVARINALPGITWKAKVHDRFRGQPLGAAKALCGVQKDAHEKLMASVSAGRVSVFKADPSVELPDAFDSEANWPKCAKVIGDIRDQSACGCCWAFGAAEAASDRLCIWSNATIKVPLSAQETCFCASMDGCDGGDLETPWSYIADQGLSTGGQVNGTGPFADLGTCTPFTLPHCHHHGPIGKDPYPSEGTKGCPNVGQGQSPQCPTACASGAKSPYNDFKSARYGFAGSVQTHADEQAIMQSIMTDGPVEAAFNVMSDFENYASGIYKSTSSKQLGGHAIRIVGWGVGTQAEGGLKYWKVANSWNPYWGEQGYFRIVRGTDECGIEDDVTSSSTGSSWNGPGLGPAPAPGPPTPGNCADQQTEVTCEHTSKGGKACEWCFLRGLGIGICQDPGTSC
jgi:cathepsin B